MTTYVIMIYLYYINYNIDYVVVRIDTIPLYRCRDKYWIMTSNNLVLLKGTTILDLYNIIGDEETKPVILNESSSKKPLKIVTPTF